MTIKLNVFLYLWFPATVNLFDDLWLTPSDRRSSRLRHSRLHTCTLDSLGFTLLYTPYIYPWWSGLTLLYTLYIYPWWSGLTLLYTPYIYPRRSGLTLLYTLYIYSWRSGLTLLCTLYIYPRWLWLNPSFTLYIYPRWSMLYSIHQPSMARVEPTILYTTTLDG